MEQLVIEVVLDTLKALKNDPAARDCDGICIILDRVLFHRSGCDSFVYWRAGDMVEEWLDIAFINWPEFSGNQLYPVPGPDGCKPDWAYANLDSWSGEYGESRLRLVDYLIDYFSDLKVSVL